MSDGAAAGSGDGHRTRRAAAQFRRLVVAVRVNDDADVESALLALSRRSRWLAPLALVVGGFVALFQGLKLLVVNWRLTIVQVLPAMWIWLAMLDLKVHVIHGREFRLWRGPLLVPLILAVAAVTAASFYLNAVFAFAISAPGTPAIRPAFARARRHAATVLGWGLVVGVLLGIAAFVVDRWGRFWFALALSVVVAVMMVAYVAVPSRLLGIRPEQSRRDRLSAAAVGGAIGAVVCSPPYLLGRLGIVLMGSHLLFWVGVVLLVVGLILQTGATSAVKAVKMSARLVAGDTLEGARPLGTEGGTGPPRG